MIDWEELETELDTTEGAPEPIIHELVHAYDCIGARAFRESIGSQKYVSALIDNKYGDDDVLSDLAEIRVAATTFLVLRRLGILTEDITKDILGDAKSNLKTTLTEPIEVLLLRAMPEAQKMSIPILSFILKFSTDKSERA